MKTITFNSNSVSAYVFENTEQVTLNTENITCSDFIIGDLNSTNATMHTDVTPPEDWMGGRYVYDGTDWTEVVGWVDPSGMTDPE